MKTYDFTFIVAEPSLEFEKAAKQIYSKCPDVLFSSCGKEYSIDFIREAKSFSLAVAQAAMDLAQVKFIKVLDVRNNRENEVAKILEELSSERLDEDALRILYEDLEDFYI